MYYTLKIEDLLVDKNFKLKLDEYAISTAIINSTNSDVSLWVDKISIKSGTLAPEFFLNWEDKLSCQDRSIVFNLGYILFSLIVGTPPFNRIEDHFYKLVIERNFDEFWKIYDPAKRLEEGFKLLAFSMLSEKPFDRPSLNQILENEWIAKSTINEADVIHEINQIIDLMNTDTQKVILALKKKTKKFSSNKVTRSVDKDLDATSDLEINEKLKQQLKEFLEFEEKQYLIEYGNYSTSSFTLYFDNSFEETIRHLVSHFSQEEYCVTFLYESIIGVRFTNLIESENSLQQKTVTELTFEVRFYEDKVNNNTLVLEFMNHSIESKTFNKLFDDYLQAIEQDF